MFLLVKYPVVPSPRPLLHRCFIVSKAETVGSSCSYVQLSRMLLFSAGLFL